MLFLLSTVLSLKISPVYLSIYHVLSTHCPVLFCHAIPTQRTSIYHSPYIGAPHHTKLNAIYLCDLPHYTTAPYYYIYHASLPRVLNFTTYLTMPTHRTVSPIPRSLSITSHHTHAFTTPCPSPHYLHTVTLSYRHTILY